MLRLFRLHKTDQEFDHPSVILKQPIWAHALIYLRKKSLHKIYDLWPLQTLLRLKSNRSALQSNKVTSLFVQPELSVTAYPGLITY